MNVRETYHNPIAVLIDNRNKSSVIKFFEELYDNVHVMLCGRKYFTEISRMEQELMTVTAAAYEELINSKSTEPVQHSGIYCVTDLNGKEAAYGMVSSGGRWGVYKYDVSCFEDLRHCSQHTLDNTRREMLHVWDADEFGIIQQALRVLVPFFPFIDRMALPSRRFYEAKEMRKEELAKFITAQVGSSAYEQSKMGAVSKGMLNVYFISAGVYKAYKFIEHTGGLKIVDLDDACVVGNVAGLTLEDVPEILKINNSKKIFPNELMLRYC